MTPPLTHVVKRTGEAVPWNREKITVAIYKAAAAIGGHDRALSERLAEQVEKTLETTYSTDLPPTVEDVQDIAERVLIKNGHAKTAKAYIVYRHERARMRGQQRKNEVENIPYKTMWQALDWAVDHECNTVEKLNAIVAGSLLPSLIRDADARYESILDDVAREILDRKHELRFVIVAGPSSSGKTTTTHKLTERLEARGVHVIPMALDNYFFDLELHPQDEHGDRDFETPEALDLQLVNVHLAALDAGRGVDMPRYDFRKGARVSGTTRFEPEPETLILLDTLHGLYDGLTQSVPRDRKFRIYIETIAQLKNAKGEYLRWADVRLLRRMIRDSLHRAYSPERTILHWHYVRRGELKHIIPYQSAADFVVDSALAYELPFLKLHLFSCFPGFLETWRSDEKRLDGFIRAERIHEWLSSVASVETDSLVPARSLLREFIGGSAYDLH